MARDWRTVLCSPELHVFYLIAMMDMLCLCCIQSSFPKGNGIIANDKVCVSSFAFCLKHVHSFYFSNRLGEAKVKK